MIKTEKEYQEAILRMDEDKKILSKQRDALKKLRLTTDQIEKALEPVMTFHEQLAEEVQWYERAKRGNLTPLSNLGNIGRYLIALRIKSGLTQKELAQKLDVVESQISRDERNEYHGISVERAQKILDILNAKFNLTFEFNDRYQKHGVAA